MRRSRSLNKRFLPSQHDPLLPLSWRWKRACFLSQRSRVPWHEEDDEFVRLAVRFLRRRERSNSPGRCRLNHRQAAVGDAHTIHDGPPPIRLALEARLLAGQSMETIASRTGLNVDVIQLYERLFYTVEDVREHQDYLFAHTVGFRRLQATFHGDRDALALVLAHSAGAVAIDSVLECLQRPGALNLKGLHPAAVGVLQTMLRMEASRLARSSAGFDNRPLIFLAVADALKELADAGERAPDVAFPAASSWALLPSVAAVQPDNAEDRSSASADAGTQPMGPEDERVELDVPEAILRRAGIQVADCDVVGV